MALRRAPDRTPGIAAGSRIDAVLAPGDAVEPGRPLLPPGLAGTGRLRCLGPAGRLVLGQVRGHAYVGIMARVAELVLPFVLDHVRPHVFGDPRRVRALLAVAAGEAEHLSLFRRFRDALDRAYGDRCPIAGPAGEIGRAVRAHHPLAVGLLCLQLSRMAEVHGRVAEQGCTRCEPRFARLLRRHAREDAAHAEVLGGVVRSIAAACRGGEVPRALEDHLAILSLLDRSLVDQVELDVETLARRTGVALTGADRRGVVAAQRDAYRRTFLRAGLEHPHVQAVLVELDPGAPARIREWTADRSPSDQDARVKRP